MCGKLHFIMNPVFILKYRQFVIFTHCNATYDGPCNWLQIHSWLMLLRNHYCSEEILNLIKTERSLKIAVRDTLKSKQPRTKSPDNLGQIWNSMIQCSCQLTVLHMYPMEKKLAMPSLGVALISIATTRTAVFWPQWSHSLMMHFYPSVIKWNQVGLSDHGAWRHQVITWTNVD